MESRIRLFPTYPLALDRGDIAIGGEADGEGELVPPPLSLTLQPSYFSPASLARASAGSYPCTSAGSPHPASACGKGYPCTSPAAPPHPRLRQGIPMHFCRQPPLRLHLRRRIPMHSLPAPPPRLHLRRRIPMHSLPAPPPRPACAAPPPGAGYVRGDTWWKAVPGSFPAYPHAVDRGGYRHRGRG